MFVSGHGMKMPRPTKKFDYPEGSARICPVCEREMMEGNGGSIMHLQLGSLPGCFPFFVAAGLDKDGNPVLLEARFL